MRPRHTVRSAVVHEALERLDDAGVSMPFPTQQLKITGEIDGPSDPSARPEQS
jgi:small-conductance mechanosensitive channel